MRRLALSLAALCATALVPAVASAQAADPHAGHVPQAQPAPAPRAPTRTPLGREPAQVLMSKVTVSDLQKSFDFYTQVVGLKRALTQSQREAGPLPTPDKMPAFVEIALNYSGSLADPFFDIVVQKGLKPSPETAKLTVVGFKVPDAPAVIARAKAAGYTVLRDAPAVGPGEMSIGMILDPDGYQVEIIQAASYPAG